MPYKPRTSEGARRGGFGTKQIVARVEQTVKIGPVLTGRREVTIRKDMQSVLGLVVDVGLARTDIGRDGEMGP